LHPARSRHRTRQSADIESSGAEAAIGDPGRGILRMGGLDLGDRPNFYSEAMGYAAGSGALQRYCGGRAEP
jgi:hypothetical protein